MWTNLFHRHRSLFTGKYYCDLKSSLRFSPITWWNEILIIMTSFLQIFENVMSYLHVFGFHFHTSSRTKSRFYVFRPRRTNRVVKLLSQQIPNKVLFFFISIHGTFWMCVMSFHFNDAYKDLWMRNQGQIQRRVDQTLILNSILKIHDIYIYIYIILWDDRLNCKGYLSKLWDLYLSQTL